MDASDDYKYNVKHTPTFPYPSSLRESAITVPPRDLGVFTPEDPAKGILVDSLGPSGGLLG